MIAYPVRTFSAASVRIGHLVWSVLEANGRCIADALTEAQARTIAAALNACKDIDADRLATLDLGAVLAERDALRAALEEAGPALAIYHNSIAYQIAQQRAQEARP